jgi:hypothetical protein
MKQLATSYSFNASAKTVTLTGLNVPLNYVLLIVNATRNAIIYNFADPATGAQSYTQGANSVITLKVDLSGMSNTDQLTIFFDDGKESALIAVQGPKGDTGSVGPKGDTGSVGPKGDTGSVGPAGPQTSFIDGGDASLFQTSATYIPTTTYSSSTSTTFPTVSQFTQLSSYSFSQPFTSDGSTYSTSGYETYAATSTQTFPASTSLNFVSSTFLSQTRTTWYEI